MSNITKKSKICPISQKQAKTAISKSALSAAENALNTLAQLDQNTSQGKSNIYFHKKKLNRVESTPLEKRARAKTMTVAVASKLYNLGSDLKNSYKASLGCAAVLHYKDEKLTGIYCNQRWCLVCSRIRTANLINGYMPVFQDFQNPHFLTFTVKNCSGSALADTLDRMHKVFTKIKRSLSRTWDIDFIGVRKIEVTYNVAENTYHPHYHAVVDMPWSACLKFQDMWLDNWPGTIRRAQDIKKADPGSLLELFKYFTKVVSKTGTGKERKITGVHTPTLDRIFTVMKGKRTFQPYGGIKKVSEEIEELQAIKINLRNRDTVFQWLENDWLDCNTGQVLTGYNPSESVKEIINNIV